jgi:hypothetical protein
MKLESGPWTSFTMIALKKKPESSKHNHHPTISLITHTARILTRTIERKTDNVLGENQFVFRRAKGTRDVTGMVRIISKQTLKIGEELCACCIGWQKASDCVKWTKSMQILKETGIEWRQRRVINKMYVYL